MRITHQLIKNYRKLSCTNRTIRRISRYTSTNITKNWFAFNKIVLKSLAQSVLIPLELTAAASATDAGIQKKIRSRMTKLIISNEEIDDIMKIVKSLEESCLLIKAVSETI